MTRIATFDRSRKRLIGMSGYLASRFSAKTKKTDIKAPNMIKQITVGESQANVVPPKFSPSSNISVSPSIVRLPNQSIALRPSIALVLGLWTSRNSKSRTKASPDKGRLNLSGVNLSRSHRVGRLCMRTRSTTSS